MYGIGRPLHNVKTINASGQPNQKKLGRWEMWCVLTTGSAPKHL